MRNRKSFLLKWCLSGFLILLFSSQVQAVTVTISGTLYSDEGITPITSADQSIHLVIDGISIATSLTDSSGNYSITTNVTGPYIPLLVYVDNGSVVGTTVTVLYSSTPVSITDLHVYANHLITRQDEGGTPLDNGDISNAVGSYNDTDILYSITGSDLTVQGTNTVLYIPTGHSYTPGGNINTQHVKINGTLTAGSNTINVSGDWNITDGTFNYDTSTVNFTGSGTIDLSHTPLPWYSDSKAFYNATISAAGQTTHLERGINVQNTLTLSTGTVTGGEILLQKDGGTPLIAPAGLTLSNFSVRYTPQNNPINVTSLNYRTLWLSASGPSITFTLLGDVTCTKLWLMGSSGKESVLDMENQTLTCNQIEVGFSSLINRYGKLQLNNSTINVNNLNIHLSDSGGTNQIIAGNSTINISGDWTNNDTYISNTSNVVFNGSSNQTLFSGGDPFYNVNIDNTEGGVNNNIFLGDDLNVNNNLITNTGKLDTTSNNYNITVLGNLDQSSTTGELEANASTLTVTGNFSADGSIDSTNYNNASLILNGAGSLFYGNISNRWRNGFNNLTVGQTGQTTTAYNSFAVLNELTVGSGALSGSSFVYLGQYLSTTPPLNLDANATISIDELRFFGSNQTIPPLNNGYDCNIRVSRGNLTLTQTGNITLNGENNLLIDGDGFADRAQTYNTNGFALNVGGSIIVGAGSDTALKTLNISNSTITLGQNFEILTGTNDLISTNSNIILNGNSAQSITMNGKSMDTLTLNNTSSAGVTFTDTFAANTVTNTTPNSTMTFAAGQNFTVNNAINLQGASGQLINLASSLPGSHWNLILNGGVSKNIDQVNVSWSDASGSHSTQIPINPNNTVRDGNTIAWFPLPSFSVTKNTTVISDPINGTGGGKNRIPGAIIEYSLTTRNTGGYSPDNNTVIVLDVIDSDHVELDVISGVTFSDGSTSSGVTLGMVSYSHRSTPTSYTYTPTGAFDPNVAGIKIKTNGTFAFGGVPNPEFTVTYRVRVK